jgi:Fe-S-cluster containining protein
MGTDAEEFLCARCARHQKTCCQFVEIYTSPGDVQRISDYTGRDDFYEYRGPDNPVYLDHDDDPVWRDNVFLADGTRRLLKRLPNGDCTFLGPQGCTLSLEVRPLICRLYPYDYDEQGIKPVLAEGCPLELLRPGQELIPTLNMNLQDAERWREQLYEEIRLEKTTDAHRLDLQPAS